MNMDKLLNVKPYQEENEGFCGPAVVKMVFDYYGLQKNEKELSVELHHAPGRGVDDKAIKKVAESYGFKVEIKNWSSFGACSPAATAYCYGVQNP